MDLSFVLVNVILVLDVVELLVSARMWRGLEDRHLRASLANPGLAGSELTKSPSERGRVLSH